MSLNKDEVAGLNVALNEATLVALACDLQRRNAVLTLDLLSLPPEGPAPDETRVELRLLPIRRVLAKMSDRGTSKQIGIEDLSELVASFEGRPIYGGEFIDPPELKTGDWRKTASFDYRLSEGDSTHVIHVFQEDGNRELAILIWFEELHFAGNDGRKVDTQEIIAGGKRWWDSVFAGDPRTKGRGIEPLS